MWGNFAFWSFVLPCLRSEATCWERYQQECFTTNAAEVMAIVAGDCRVRLEGEGAWLPYSAGTSFSVAANSAFDIVVESGIAEYVCSFG